MTKEGVGDRLVGAGAVSCRHNYDDHQCNECGEVVNGNETRDLIP